MSVNPVSINFLDALNSNGSTDLSVARNYPRWNRVGVNSDKSGQDGAFTGNVPPKSRSFNTITDFSVPDDTIALSAAGFGMFGFTLGTLPSSAFGIGNNATNTAQRVVYNPVNGNLLFDRDGSGSRSPVLLGTVFTGLAMTNQDILLV